jgi:hypothetical protein
VSLTIPLAYALAAFTVDLLPALFPSLTVRLSAVATLGATAMLVTVVAPAFPTLGHHAAAHPWLVPPLVGAITFGAFAANLGWRMGWRIGRSLGIT